MKNFILQHSVTRYKILTGILIVFVIFLQSCGNPEAKLHCDALSDGNMHETPFQVDSLMRQTYPSFSSSHVPGTASSGTVLFVRSRAASERVFNPHTSFQQPTPQSANTMFPMKLRSGVTVTFNQLDGQWLATVKNDFLRRQETLPVICPGDVASVLLDLRGAREVNVLKRIHLVGADQGTQYVYVGAMGLRGGGKRSRKRGIAKISRKSLRTKIRLHNKRLISIQKGLLLLKIMLYLIHSYSHY